MRRICILTLQITSRQVAGPASALDFQKRHPGVWQLKPLRTSDCGKQSKASPPASSYKYLRRLDFGLMFVWSEDFGDNQVRAIWALSDWLRSAGDSACRQKI